MRASNRREVADGGYVIDAVNDAVAATETRLGAHVHAVLIGSPLYDDFDANTSDLDIVVVIPEASNADRFRYAAHIHSILSENIRSLVEHGRGIREALRHPPFYFTPPEAHRWLDSFVSELALPWSLGVFVSLGTNGNESALPLIPHLSQPRLRVDLASHCVENLERVSREADRGTAADYHGASKRVIYFLRYLLAIELDEYIVKRASVVEAARSTFPQWREALEALESERSSAESRLALARTAMESSVMELRAHGYVDSHCDALLRFKQTIALAEFRLRWDALTLRQDPLTLHQAMSDGPIVWGHPYSGLDALLANIDRQLSVSSSTWSTLSAQHSDNLARLRLSDVTRYYYDYYFPAVSTALEEIAEAIMRLDPDPVLENLEVPFEARHFSEERR